MTEKFKLLYYKVLVNGRSCNGGDMLWSLPVQQPDGTWVPGDWHEVEGPLQLYYHGLHITREPARWWKDGAECYEVEWSGDHVGNSYDDKIAVRRARLKRRLNADELIALRVFLSGCHAVKGGVCAAAGSAVVVARDSTHVVALDSAHVEARGSTHVVAQDSARVVAFDSAHVEARGSTRVEAWDSARVVGRDSTRVMAWGSTRVVAWDSTHVEARGSAYVVAHGSAHVEARDWARVETPNIHTWDVPTVTVVDHAVWIDWQNGKAIVHTPLEKKEADRCQVELNL